MPRPNSLEFRRRAMELAHQRDENGDRVRGHRSRGLGFCLRNRLAQADIYASRREEVTSAEGAEVVGPPPQSSNRSGRPNLSVSQQQNRVSGTRTVLKNAGASATAPPPPAEATTRFAAAIPLHNLVPLVVTTHPGIRPLHRSWS